MRLVRVLGKHWMQESLHVINEYKDVRFNELKEKLILLVGKDLTSKTLSNNLRLLQKYKLIKREVVKIGVVEGGIESHYIILPKGNKICELLEILDEMEL